MKNDNQLPRRKRTGYVAAYSVYFKTKLIVPYEADGIPLRYPDF